MDRKNSQMLSSAGSDNVDDDDEPDWMKNFVPHREPELDVKKKLVIRAKKGKEETVRELLSAIKDGGGRGNGNGKEVKNVKAKDEAGEVEDEEFLLEEYDSEGECGGKSKRKSGGIDDASTSEEDEIDGSGEGEEEAKLKVYFCSRTHSQLSQFVNELRKTKFASELKVVCLGSRKNYCINEGIHHIKLVPENYCELF